MVTWSMPGLSKSILLTKGEDLTVKAKSYAKFLVVSGKPINE